MTAEITLQPVGWVKSPRRDLTDDHWGGTISFIELDANQFGPAALAGLSDFSHLEIIYYFHAVPDSEIETGARHPRGRQDWPLVGIFAQRAKGRPNRLGLSRCRLLEVNGLSLKIVGLDAVDGTPVLDIKPYMTEFAPLEETTQPSWSVELMQHYYDSDES